MLWFVCFKNVRKVEDNIRGDYDRRKGARTHIMADAVNVRRIQKQHASRVQVRDY